MFKATIAIPFYNNERTLENTIKSVINQTYKEWKMILINDGSTDRSLKIAEKYVSENVILINDGENKGLISRLNQAINLTDTPFFVRMDSDDLMTPDRLEKQIAYLNKYTDIELVGANAYIIDKDNEIVSIRRVSNSPKTISDVIKAGLFIHPTVTGRTEWFKNNLYHHDFERAEDLELWCRSIDNLKYFNFEEPLLFYRDPIVMDIQKYRKSFVTKKKIINVYFKGNLKKKLLLRENMKYMVYQMLSSFKLSNALSSRRNLDLEKEQLLTAQKILANTLK